MECTPKMRHDEGGQSHRGSAVPVVLMVDSKVSQAAVTVAVK